MASNATCGVILSTRSSLHAYDKPAVVLRLTDGHYDAVVDSQFIPIEGNETLFKALLTAVHQRGEGIVTSAEGAQLRQILVTFMQTEADRLGALWQHEPQVQPLWQPDEHVDGGDGQFLCSLAELSYPELAARQNFTFVPRITSKARVLASIACFVDDSPLGGSNASESINHSLLPAVGGNITRHMLSVQNEKNALGFITAVNGRAAHNDVALPLMAASTAPIVVRPSSGSKTMRTAMGILGLTSFIYASKQLISWYQGRTTPTTSALQQQSVHMALIDPHRYPDIKLENTEHEFSISSGKDYPASVKTQDEKIAYRLALSVPDEIPSTTITTTTRRESDDVRIEQLDLSCVERGQALSLGDVLRQIGDTLSYPVTELAKQIQVISYYERYKQCPTEKDIEQLESMTTRIDEVISAVISFIPYSTPLVLCQSLGGPLFKLFGDAIDGHDLDINNLEAINDQVLFLGRTTWEFTPRERHGQVKMDKVKLPGKTVFKKNKLSAIINHDFFNLHREKEQYIGRSPHSTRQVRYSSLQNSWVFHDHSAYFYEEKYHRDMVNSYKADKDYIRNIRNNNERVSIDNHNDIMHIVTKENNHVKFILMDNGKGKVNVESDFYRVNGVYYGYAKKAGQENKIIRFNRNKFYFEARSAKINKGLADKISNDVRRKTASEDFHVTSIKNDGFSYDRYNNKYLKYNNGYHQVETDDNMCEYILASKDNKSERVYIKKNQEGFFDIDNGFTWGKLEKLFIKTNDDIYLTKETHDEIQKNCVLHDRAVTHKVDNGIFRNDASDFFFSLNGAFYQVGEYQKDIITLKSKYANVDDIALYTANDYFFETNNKNSIDESHFLAMMPSSCKIRRSPLAASCNTALISPGADSLLRTKTKKGAVDLSNDEAQLSSVSTFPSVFTNSQNKKLYFKHDGKFYKASFSNGIELNLLKQTTLHVYYNGFLGSRKNIASLVFDKINGKTIIQTQEEKLQWKAGMTVKESIDFVRDSNFLKIPDFTKLEDVVADVNSKKAIKFVTLPSNYQQGNIKESLKLYLNYNDDNFDIHSMNDISDADPFYLRGGALLVDNSIKYATQQIDVAVRELNNFTPNAQKYIGYVLGVEEEGAVRDFSTHLSNKLTRIKAKINKDNIKLVSKNREPIQTEQFERDSVRDADTLQNPPVHENYYHQAGISEIERGNGVLAMVPLDFKRNIYVCLDRLYFIDPTHPDTTLRKEPVTDITETLIHEATHSAGIDADITYISTEDGKVIPVLDAIDEYRENIIINRLRDKGAFIQMRQEYMKLHPEYSTVADTLRDDNMVLDYLFTHDIGFKANVLLGTPDFLPVFVRDLSANAPVKLRAR